MATATRTINRKSGAKIEITLTRDVIDDIAYADGYNIKVGRKLVDRTEIVMTTADGHKERGNAVAVLNPKFSAQAIQKGAYAYINPRAYLSRDAYDLVMAALAELEAEVGKSDEYRALEQAQARRLARAEADSRQMAAEQAARAQQPGWCQRCGDWTYGDCGHRN